MYCNVTDSKFKGNVMGRQWDGFGPLRLIDWSDVKTIHHHHHDIIFREGSKKKISLKVFGAFSSCTLPIPSSQNIFLRHEFNIWIWSWIKSSRLKWCCQSKSAWQTKKHCIQMILCFVQVLFYFIYNVYIQHTGYHSCLYL